MSTEPAFPARLPSRRLLRPGAVLGVAVAAAWLAAGCAGTPERYYTLAAPAAASAPTPAPAAAPQLAIELTPVAMPERLARPQMVVRRRGDAAEVSVLEQQRWASSFEVELRDALGAGIASRLGAVDATRGGPPAASLWRIDVQLRRFDAVQDTRIDAAFGWTVRRAEGERSAVCEWSASEPVGAGFESLAQGAQRVTAGVAAAVARHVAALQADPAAGCPR